MLREMFRSRPEARSKGLFKEENLDSLNYLSDHSTNPVTVIQNSMITNSKRIMETNNGNRPNTGLTNNTNSNNNILTESYCLPSSPSLKAKGNSSYSNYDKNVNPPTNNHAHEKISSILQRNSGIPYNYQCNHTKKESQIEHSNTSQLPGNLPKNRSYSLSTNRLQCLESFITQINQNVYEKSKPLITHKSRVKDILQNNVDILSSNIRTVHKEHKVNGQLNKTILKENDRLVSTGERAVRDTYFMNKELPALRYEIDEMKNLISQHTEETQYIRNDHIQTEREVLLLKDEIKNANGQIAQILKQKERLTNAMVVISRHIEMTKEKIEKIERSSDELMNSVHTLVEQSSHVFDHMKI